MRNTCIISVLFLTGISALLEIGCRKEKKAADSPADSHMANSTTRTGSSATTRTGSPASLRVLRPRRLGELQLDKYLTSEQVAAAWGPADDVMGFGISYPIYYLDDGSSLILRFGVVSPYRLELARLVESGGSRILFDSSKIATTQSTTRPEDS